MVFEAHMVVSIQHLVDERCPFIIRNLASLAADRAKCDWLVILTTKVDALVRCGLPVVANSLEFFSESELEPMKFSEITSSVGRRKHVKASKVEATVLSYMQRILHQWFGSETPFTSQAKAALVGCFVDRFGISSLLLPLVWKTYTEIPQWLFSTDCPKLKNGDTSIHSRFEMRFLAPFLLAVDVIDPNRNAKHTLSGLDRLYEELRSRTKDYVDDFIATRSQGARLKEWVASMSSESMTSIPKPSTSPIFAFLEDSVVALTARQRSQGDTHLTQAQRYIFLHLDHLLPLREDTPSRTIMRQSFDVSLADTRIGFFSMQLFRFIHCNSGAFRSYPPELRRVVFNSVEDHDDYLANMRALFPDEPGTFFCNKKSIANSIRGNSSTISRNYWNAAHSPHLKWPPPRPFAEAWSEMLALKRKLDAQIDAPWKGVGLLSIYLLVVDMHYSGLVDAPLPMDVAQAIPVIRGCSVQGMQSLGYISDCATKSDVEKKFCQYYNDVDTLLTDDQRARYKWDPIVAEHTLSTLFRARTDGYYITM